MSKKIPLKRKYELMTRGLAWDTTYQDMDDVYPYDKFEGIKIHDWDDWVDPFRLTQDAYWKFQAEKERKLYAVIDSYAQNNGQLGLSDARYLGALKLFLTGVSPLEYQAHRHFAQAVDDVEYARGPARLDGTRHQDRTRGRHLVGAVAARRKRPRHHHPRQSTPASRRHACLVCPDSGLMNRPVSYKYQTN